MSTECSDKQPRIVSAKELMAAVILENTKRMLPLLTPRQLDMYNKVVDGAIKAGKYNHQKRVEIHDLVVRTISKRGMVL